MINKSSQATIAYTLFCDDIRHEEGHKYSAMGVYVTALAIEGPEQVLPKFVAMTMLEVPASDTGKTGKIAFLDHDSILIESDINLPSPPEGMDDLNARFLASVPIEAAPFTAKVGMRLSVKFEIGDFKYHSPALEVIEKSDMDVLSIKQSFNT